MCCFTLFSFSWSKSGFPSKNWNALVKPFFWLKKLAAILFSESDWFPASQIFLLNPIRNCSEKNPLPCGSKVFEKKQKYLLYISFCFICFSLNNQLRLKCIAKINLLRLNHSTHQSSGQKKNNEVLRGQQRQCRGELILNNMKKLEEMLADYYYCNQNFFFVFRFLQSCRCVSTSHLRQREGILILLLFLCWELNFVKVLLRFVRPLLT